MRVKKHNLCICKKDYKNCNKQNNWWIYYQNKHYRNKNYYK